MDSMQSIEDQLAIYHRKHQVARERLLKALQEVPEQPYTLLTKKLHVPGRTLQAMQKQGILRIESESSLRNPVTLGNIGGDTISLSPEQQAVSDGVLQDYLLLQQKKEAASVSVENLRSSNDDNFCDEKADALICLPSRVSLIYGITGSGKTEVYISIIKRIVATGHQAIMLIPEISLTYQTLIRFYRHFGNRVSVMNSTLSEGEKSDQFERARRGEIDVIIGPRSALFTPFPKLGVIVIDEEHENSYKNESMPKYHARDVAVQIAKMRNAVVVLGSATPSLSSYYKAQKGEYRLYTLNRRLTGGTLPDVEIADMREELKAGNRSILSRRLTELLQDRLDRHEQTMLFLNRRGFSGFVSCRSCGYVPKCPHCSVSLSLHREDSHESRNLSGTGRSQGIEENAAKQTTGYKLVCHYCGYEEQMPARCPECGSPYISGFRVGTEQVEQMLQKMYPRARVLRMDADTTKKKGSYEAILSSFANEEADILVGTQMIVKGHDFPNVTLVGILLADMSLNINDYRAGERTFQLLTQAAGRAGRGTHPGNVVIQTYDPDNYSIVHAAHQDYPGFYEEEITYRRLLRYPPVEHMMAVQITSKSEDHAQLFAGQTRELLEKIIQNRKKYISSCGTDYYGNVSDSQKLQNGDASDLQKINGNEDRGIANDILIIGPSAASLGKLRDEYRYVLYIKSADYDKLVFCKDAVEAAEKRARAADPKLDTQFQFDFDPVNPY